MKISDVIKQTLDIVQKKPLERSSGDNTSDFTAFTGDLQQVDLQDTKVEAPERAGKTPSGNDKSPEDLYVPPLQQKLELLKKAVDVENIYDDGPPDVQYQATDDGEWRGADNKHEYIGAPWTAEQVEGATEGTEQPDPNEGEEEERKRADEDLERMRRFTNLGEAKKDGRYSVKKEFTGAQDGAKFVVRFSDKFLKSFDTKEAADKFVDEHKAKRDADLSEEKSPKAKKDWDGDGKIESEKDEVIGSRRKAAGLDEDEQLDEQSEDLGRIRQLAGLNPVVLDELASDFPDE
jgi:hypothetical protein